jgi:hypothetical protein
MTSTIAHLLAVATFLLAANTANADAPDWQINPPDFELAASLTAQVLADGVPLTDSGSLVAAFVGDEIRGVAAPIEALDQFLYFITTYANSPGETLQFRLYVADRDTVVTLDQSLVFEPNAVVGAPDSPFQLHTSLQVITAVALQVRPEEAALTMGLAFPNPFNSDTTLPWYTTQPGRVEIVVQDLLGRAVRQLHAGWRPTGPQQMTWDGRDNAGLPAASGVYHVVVTAFGTQHVQRIALIR